MNIQLFDIVYALGNGGKLVPFSQIPTPLLEDFMRFMTGRTFIKKHDEFVAYPSDFRAWLNKLSLKGIDAIPYSS